MLAKIVRSLSQLSPTAQSFEEKILSLLFFFVNFMMANHLYQLFKLFIH